MLETDSTHQAGRGPELPGPAVPEPLNDARAAVEAQEAPAGEPAPDSASFADADSAASTRSGTDSSAEGPAHLEELALLRRLRRGEPRAFAHFVRLYQDRVFELVFRMLGDREEALDLSQEIFVSIHDALRHFRADCRLSTWVYRIARNHCLNQLKYLDRRDRRRRADLDSVDEEALEGAVQPVLRPDEAYARGEVRELLQRALLHLSEEHRLLIVLRDVEGLSYQEIAAVTEQPEGTVKSRLHRARAALAEVVARLERT